MEDPKAQESCLQEAQHICDSVRGADYGHPLDDWTRTAAMWSAVLGVPVTAEQALLCMVCVKVSRECNRPKRDNLVDIAGYAYCLERVQQRREGAK